ncbi:MAG: hypothetical protein ACJ8AJ_02920 [Gemmatimonadaceae bacterium]
MRAAMLGLVLATVTACSGSTDPREMGTLSFNIDPVTCTGTHATYFAIDYTEVGPESLGPGGTSKGYVVTADRHVARARIMNYFGTPAALWTANVRITVPANGSATTLLVC